MASLQYVIDSICTSLTVESMYELIKVRLRQGAFSVDDILPSVQSNDRSLDSSSARMLAKAALEELAHHGDIRVEGDSIFPAE